MLKNRILLEKYIEQHSIKIALNQDLSGKILDYAKRKYNINKGMTSDLICLRTSLSEVSEFTLFALLDTIENETNQSSVIHIYFTPQEIENYSKSSFITNEFKFPLRFKMVQISFDQWIGKIDMDMLMQMRNAQLINYNINAQRTMKKIKNNDKEIYKITLNQSSVKSICEMYNSELYIPTTLTLNIPEDTECEFYYDEDSSELVIENLEHFDITDGYHRYIAACRCYDENNNFNYKMELRIVNFSLNKANMFIYQEDQKTKMKKIDSNSFNLNNDANIVIEKINQNPMFNLKGKITRNDGLINYGELSQLINYLYFKDSSKDNRQYQIISVAKKIIHNFNILTEFNDLFLEKKYTFKELFVILYIFKEYEHLDGIASCELVIKSLENINQLNNKKFTSKIAKKSSFNEISKLVKECYEVVQ